MSNIIATVSGVDGAFYVKSPDGTLRELSNGDVIHEGDIVVGSSSNSKNNSILLVMQDGTDIVLSANEEQLFDSSLANSEFSKDETVTTAESLDEASDLLDIFNEVDEEVDSDNMETASGSESQGSTPSNASFSENFDVINDVSVDVSAALRESDSSQFMDKKSDLNPYSESSSSLPLEDNSSRRVVFENENGKTDFQTPTEPKIDTNIESIVDTITDNFVVDLTPLIVNVANLTELAEAATAAANDAAIAAQNAATVATENPTPENLAAAEAAQEAAVDAATAATNAAATLQAAITTLNAAADAANESVDTAAAEAAVTDATTAANTATTAATQSEAATDNEVALMSTNVANLTELAEAATAAANDAAIAAQNAATVATENPTPENLAAAEAAQEAAVDAATAATNAAATLQAAITTLNAAADAANESVDTAAAEAAVTDATTAANTATTAATQSEAATESLEVETEGIDLHYSNIGSTNGDNDYGDEAALVGSDNAENLTTGDGDDSVIIDNDIESNVTIDLGAGDDVIEVGDDFDSGYINSGKGDDTVIIHDDLGDNYTGETGHISTGAGDDSVTVGKLKDDSTITTGSGDDNVVLEEVSSSFDNGSVSLGSGDDILEINDDLEGTDGMFYGGAGNDTLVLKDVTQEEWDAGIKEHFVGFENTILQDATLSSENDLSIFDSSFIEEFDNTQDDGTIRLTKTEDSSSAVIDLGVENAGKTVEISFNATSLGTWDNGGAYDDDFIFNGEELMLPRGEQQSFTFETTINDNGEVKIDFDSKITGSDEGVIIENFEIAPSGDDWSSNGATNDDNAVLLIEGDETIDLSALDSNNSEFIDTITLGDGAQNIVNISLEDVVELTDESNILRIEGDVTDKITLNMTDGNGHGHGNGNRHGADGEENGWKLGDFKTDAETGATYQEVTGKVDDKTVTLEINAEIQIDQN